jgi:hypothetical protein
MIRRTRPDRPPDWRSSGGGRVASRPEQSTDPAGAADPAGAEHPAGEPALAHPTAEVAPEEPAHRQAARMGHW